MKIVKTLVCVVFLHVFLPFLSHAASNAGVFPGDLPNLLEPKKISALLETLIVLTLLSLIPTLLIMTTSFLRMVIVLGFLRHAMGTQQTPPNALLLSLAMILTFFVMTPTWNRVYEGSIKPYQNKKVEWAVALERGLLPIKEFMLRQTRQPDLMLTLSLAKAARPKNPIDAPFSTLVTAFVLSELKTAFQIGFMLFVPFLVIDLVVASILMSLGMMMVPPTLLSLPLKLLLFVMVDGWNLLIKGLVESVR